MLDWSKVAVEVEDLLAPQLQLDVYERTLYYHMLRHTRLVGKESAVFGLATLASATAMSDWKVREAVRSMDSKGCIKIEDRSTKGHLVRVLLPSELPNVQAVSKVSPTIDVETLDFFTERRYLTALLAREDEHCFYCLRRVAPESCVLDHANPQVSGRDNSYRNIVVACHECNSAKQGRNGEDFIRLLYRNGILSGSECQDRLEAVTALRSGKLVPQL
jgi:HNH endonuclease